MYNAGLDAGAFAGPIAGGFLASAAGIPATFRLVTVGLLVAYFLAALMVTQTEKSKAGISLTKG